MCFMQFKMSVLNLILNETVTCLKKISWNLLIKTLRSIKTLNLQKKNLETPHSEFSRPVFSEI